MLAWKFDVQPEPGSRSFDQIVVTEISLRAPLGGGRSGGEVAVQLYFGDDNVAEARVALDPGAVESLPKDLKAAIEGWVLDLLRGKGILPGGATQAERPKPKKDEPAPAPPGFAPVLG